MARLSDCHPLVSLWDVPESAAGGNRRTDSAAGSWRAWHPGYQPRSQGNPPWNEEAIAAAYHLAEERRRIARHVALQRVYPGTHERMQRLQHRALKADIISNMPGGTRPSKASTILAAIGSAAAVAISGQNDFGADFRPA